MTETTTKIYAEFHSPGSFVDEVSSREIETMDPAAACEIVKEIKERHGATPYGFRFVSMLTHEPIPDGKGGEMRVEPKPLMKTGFFYLNATPMTFDDVEAHGGDVSILLSNMRSNGWWVVVECINAYRTMRSFGPGDATVSPTGEVLVRGAEFNDFRLNCEARFRDQQ